MPELPSGTKGCKTSICPTLFTSRIKDLSAPMSAPPLPHTRSNSHFVRRVKLRLAYRLAFVILGDGILSMSFHCHGFTGQRDSFNAFSLSWLCRQCGSFNVFSLSWFPRAMGFFQCLFIVMASQGSGVLSKSVIVMVSQGNGILKAVGFFISMSFHCHGFTGQWDSEGSGILYFNAFSLSWFHRAMGF